MTGTRSGPEATAGASTACAPCWLTSTPSASIISAAFAAAWHVPAGAPTAESGQWIPGPGADLFGALEKALGGLPFVAEDLGIITPDVVALRDAFRVPGTRVLQFAFDGHSDNPHLPENYVHNTVVYTGTHDNPTTRGWYEDLPETERRNLWRSREARERHQRGRRPRLVAAGVVVGGGPRDRAVAGRAQPGEEARMNRPGTAEGNWRWRATEDC